MAKAAHLDNYYKELTADAESDGEQTRIRYPGKSKQALNDLNLAVGLTGLQQIATTRESYNGKTLGSSGQQELKTTKELTGTAHAVDDVD